VGRGRRSAAGPTEQLVEVATDGECAERENAERLRHHWPRVLQVSHLVNVP